MTEEGYRRGILGVALATALLALPFLGSLPLFDPDEGYYPATAAESLAHGHPFDLTLNGEPRWNKPPLSYALMQGGILLFGRNEFAVRLPSVLEGAALIAILGLVVARVAGGKAGLLSSVVLASCLGFQVMTRAAHPEMGLVLRYVARFEANGKARVGVEAVRPEHPLAALLPCDNVFAIESRWYRDNPLVIRGPGAGRDVTAGAIQSDINRLAKLL